jgi:hypothetical protein
MLDEPASKQRAVDDINLFIVQNYLVVAHVAALRFLLRRHIQNLPAAAVNAELAEIGVDVHHALDRALNIWGESAAAKATNMSESEGAAAADAQGMDSWSGWHLLKRRAGLLRDDARQIVVHSKAIAQALQTVPD